MMAAAFLTASAGGQARGASPGSKGLDTCLRIREEIRDVSEFMGIGLVKWEGFIGGPDDDDTNKDQHVLIMIRLRDEGESMTIAVTALERSRNDPKVKYARGTRTLVCGLADGTASLISADGGLPAWDKTAAEVLRAVLDKKRLLRER
jgi:hypothetical protein